MDEKEEKRLLQWYNEIDSDDDNYLSKLAGSQSSSSSDMERSSDRERSISFSEDDDDSIRDPNFESEECSESESGEDIIEDENLDESNSSSKRNKNFGKSNKKQKGNIVSTKVSECLKDNSNVSWDVPGCSKDENYMCRGVPGGSKDNIITRDVPEYSENTINMSRDAPGCSKDDNNMSRDILGYSTDDNVSRNGPGYSNGNDSNGFVHSEVSRNSEERIESEDEGHSEGIGDNGEWQGTLGDNIDLLFDVAQSGSRQHLDNFDPFQSFELLWSDEIWNLILEKTNAYGENLFMLNRPKRKHERFKLFRAISIDELKKFFGLCLLAALVKSREIRHMFSHNPLYYHPIFPATMSGRRFEQILRCLNCANNEASANDTLYKVSSLLKLFVENSQRVYYPKEALSLDESLLLFRGRLKFRVYIKNKKTRYGIKFYELCSSDGYVLNVEIYKGKHNEEDVRTEPKIISLVKRLMGPYLNKGHHLYMDNFYNSVELSQELLDEYRTHTTGTLRCNKKGNPKHIVKKKLKKGEHIWARKDNVYVSKWKDKRKVLAITTGHQPKQVVVNNRYGQARREPVEIAAYNENMSGIDRADQMISYYSCPRKTIRWPKKVIFHVLDMALWNAYHLHKNYANNKKNLLNFREFIIKRLLGISTEETLDGRDFVRAIPNKKRKRAAPIEKKTHFMEIIPVPETCKRKKYFLRCRICTNQKKRKETCWRCKVCPDKPPLCPGACFEEWHK